MYEALSELNQGLADSAGVKCQLFGSMSSLEGPSDELVHRPRKSRPNDGLSPGRVGYCSVLYRRIHVLQSERFCIQVMQ